MPLDKSGSKKSVGTNVRREISSGKSQRQAVAIALSVARRARQGKADGGQVSNGLPSEGDFLADRMLYGAGEYTQPVPDSRFAHISRMMPMLQRGAAQSAVNRNDSTAQSVLRALGFINGNAAGGAIKRADGGPTDSDSPASGFLNPITSELLRRSVLPAATSWATGSAKPLLSEVTPRNVAQTALETMPIAGPIAKGLEVAARYAKPAAGAAAGLWGLLGPSSTQGNPVGAGSEAESPEAEIARLSDSKAKLQATRDQLTQGFMDANKNLGAELTGKGKTGKPGKGPTSDALASQTKAVQDQASGYDSKISDIDTRIKYLQHTMTPEYRQEQDLAKANIEARKPWYERTGIPGAEAAMTWGPSIAAAGLARYKFNAITDEGVNLLKAVKSAPSVAEEARARVALDAWRRSAPMSAVKAAGEAALIPGGVRTTGNIGDANFGPEVKDAQGNVLPGGAKQQAQQHFARMFGSEGWPGVGEELGPQALQGAEAVAAGALFSKHPPLGDITSQTAYLKGMKNPDASLFGPRDASTMSPDAIAAELAKRRALGLGSSSSPAGPIPLESQTTLGSPTTPALSPPRGLDREYPGSPTTSPRTVAEELGAISLPSSNPALPAPNGAVGKALTAAKSPPELPAAPDLGTASEKLPPGLARDVNGQLFDKHTGQKVYERYAKAPGKVEPESTPAKVAKQPKALKAPKDKDNSLTNGKDEAVMDENGNWVKPPKLPDPNAAGDFARGGSVMGKALALARKYAHGGAVVGSLVGNTGGRSDKLARSVPPGSHVWPADVVSHLGEGNSLAGLKLLEREYGPAQQLAGGGGVDVMLSDGEYVAPPEAVARAGGGNMERGHAAMDRDILATRQHAIKTLRSLPPPSR